MKSFIKENSFRKHLRNTRSLAKIDFHTFNLGWGGGYIVIPKDHPFFKMSIEKLPIKNKSILNYSNVIKKNFLEIFKELDNNDVGSYLIGFDTTQTGFNSSWTKQKVKKQIDKLVKEIESYEKQEKKSKS